MNTYRLLIEGRGLAIPANALDLGTAEEFLGGFFTTRLQRAQSEQEAKVQALAQVEREWAQGRYARIGAQPVLAVSEIEPLSFLKRLRARSTGYAFYPAQEGTHAS